MKIIAYTYDADYHCPPCTQKRFPARPHVIHAVDENGVDMEAIDRECNPVQPVFNTDDTPPATVCCDCHAIITQPFFEQCIEAAIAAQNAKKGAEGV